MKRYMHAWIALRAIERLGKLAENQLRKATKEAQNKINLAKEKTGKRKQELLQEAGELMVDGQSNYDSIMNLQEMLRKKEFTKLVLQGTWIPDNVIGDNNTGHTWKYEPPLKKGEKTNYWRGDSKYEGYLVKEKTDDEKEKRTHYRTDHAETNSICFEEAKNTYAYDKYWRKVDGYLADRCEAVHQRARDSFLFQIDEMHKLAATLVYKFGEELFEKKEEVKEFLSNPVEVKVYYDMKHPDGSFVHRDHIIDIRNKIGNDKIINKKIKNCLEAYRVDIKKHIIKSNGMQFLTNQSSFFPMFYTNNQIILELFALSHYIADAHMPLHCDKRGFSSKKCYDIHGKIEKKWERWIISSKNENQLKRILSESERAEEFMKKCYNQQEPKWTNYIYPKNSILNKFDQQLGNQFWEDRDIEFYEKVSLWEEIVGATYASYCVSSRLVEFNDKKRVVPFGTKDLYSQDYTGEVAEIKGKQWENNIDGNGLEQSVKDDPIRKSLYDFVVKHAPKKIPFTYLSLISIIDAVDSIAKIWGRIVKDHLDITYQKN